MDIHEALKLKELADQQIDFAKQYMTAREQAGKAKSDLDILLASRFLSIRTAKKNVGYEAALIMLMETDIVAQKLYQTMTENTAKYKGLEKLIEALQSKISLAQSVMRYTVRGESYGG